MLRLGLLASGHAAGVGAGDAAGFALRDVSAFCRYISGERNESTRGKVRKQRGSVERERVGGVEGGKQKKKT